MQVTDMIPGLLYDIHVKDVLVSTDPKRPPLVKRRLYLGPFSLDDVAFIEVTDPLRREHLIPVALIADVFPVALPGGEVSDVE